MLGFVYVNPALPVVQQDYRRYVSEYIRGKDDAKAVVAKFIKHSSKDGRRKALWIEGVDKLLLIQQAFPDFDGVVGVFDTGDKLSQVPTIKIVDAHLEGDEDHRVWRSHTINLRAEMDDDKGGFTETSTAKTSPPPPNSLPRLFDPLLEAISSAKKRSWAAEAIAARLQGLLEKETWNEALEQIQKFGLDKDLVKAAFRVYKASGEWSNLLAASEALLDGNSLEKVVKNHNVREPDLKWVLTHRPLENG